MKKIESLTNVYTAEDLLSVMNMGMSLRQSQLNGSDTRSGNELLEIWKNDKHNLDNKFKTTKRELFLLKKELSFPITRYLLSCLTDGGERARRHIEISDIIVQFIFCEEDYVVANQNNELYSILVHNFLALVLTDRLDEVIGFPIDRKIYGNEYDKYVNKFFDVIVLHLGEMEKLLK